MAKISFNKLGLKKDTDVILVKIGEVEVEVKRYLPIEEKISLVELVMQESMEYGFINPLRLEKFFNLYFVYKYTNISFSDSVRKDENALYDLLEANKVFDIVAEAAREDYLYLFEKCEEYLDKYEQYQNSFYGMASKVINSVPETMTEAMNALQNLDLDKVSETMKIASVNGGNQEALVNLIHGQNK